MLTSLNIKNVALITQLQLNLTGGLNVLSGETGAGKSIIIDSLNFVMGGKADKTLVRHNEEVMSVEAVFCVDISHPAYSSFSEFGLQEDDIILYRALSSAGRSEIRINGRAATLSVLKQVSSKLADVYGQSEHISLMNKGTHIQLVDSYCKEEIFPLKQDLKQKYALYKGILKELHSYGGNEKERLRLIELYTYQAQEIQQANLKEGEEESLKALQTKYSNMQKITEDVSGAVEALSGGEYSVSQLLTQAVSGVQRAMRYDSELTALHERINSARLEFDDISSELRDYLSDLDYDSAEADRTQGRLDVIKGLQRKYGDSVREIMEYYNKTSEELDKLTGSAESIRRLNAEKAKLIAEIYAISVKLSSLRREKAKQLEAEVLKNLSELSMKGTDFKVSFIDLPDIAGCESSITDDGMDDVEFLISPNAGEPLKPLSKIISGGEMSRFMLAVKNITSEVDHIDTLVFDEIDTGISGTTATAVAKKFAGISKSHQIIAITHLPQIAAMSDTGYLITKSAAGGTTTTSINALTADGKVAEIARLIGAADISEHAALHAKQMIQWSDEYKQSL